MEFALKCPKTVSEIRLIIGTCKEEEGASVAQHSPSSPPLPLASRDREICTFSVHHANGRGLPEVTKKKYMLY